jgi:hypothetical protein
MFFRGQNEFLLLFKLIFGLWREKDPYTAKNNSDAILIKLEELAASEFIKEAYGIFRI